MEPFIIAGVLFGFAGILGYARYRHNAEDAYAAQEEHDRVEAEVFKRKLVESHGNRHTPVSPVPVARNYTPKPVAQAARQSRPSPSKPSPDNSISSAIVGAAIGYALGSSGSSSSSSDSSSSSSSSDSSYSSGGDFGGGGSSSDF